MNFLREGIDDLKDHLDQFKEIHLHLTLETGSVLKYRLEGKNEIELFLNEMIISRKGSYTNKKNNIRKPTPPKPTKKINFLQKIINKLYA